MSRPKLRFLILVLIAWSGLDSAWPDQKAPLPERFRSWLEEEVVTIITPRERDVFRKLQTDRERDIFIEAFWKHRDPTPDTPENGFKTEHYRRIGYADHRFGRSAPLPGWKTDRGRIYIILGEPNDIQRYDAKAEVVPCEVWFYQDKVEMGLPPGFNLVFFQEHGQGDFRLYSPAGDGPQALLMDFHGNANDYRQAYQTLGDLEPNLASVSLSLIPGEAGTLTDRPSLASDILIQKVETAPQTLVKDDYARKFFEYKDIVDVEYSANYMDSDALVAVAEDGAGVYFVHYAVEPKRLSVSGGGDTYTTTLRVNGIVTNPAGTAIHQFEKTFFIKIEKSRMEEINRQPFDLHDLFPLIPGTYKMSILVKNEVSKEFTSFEQALLVPEDIPGPRITKPLLGYKWSQSSPDPQKLRPFQFGPYRIYAQPGRTFARTEKLVAAFQVSGLTEPERKAGLLRYQILKDGAAVAERSKRLDEYAGLPDVLEEFALKELVPAHYGLKIGLLIDGREVLAVEDEFDLSHQEVFPRPWIQSKLMPGAGEEAYEQILGAELFNAGRIAEAKIRLERAYRKNPESPESALFLSRALAAMGKVEDTISILEPFLDPARPPNYEIFVLAARARQGKADWAGALEITNRTISHFGANTVLLNAVGDCELGLGKTKQALAAWEKSLEFNPDQPEIRRKIAELKSGR
jgi:GWxTD domain-containing protein